MSFNFNTCCRFLVFYVVFRIGCDFSCLACFFFYIYYHYKGVFGLYFRNIAYFVFSLIFNGFYSLSWLVDKHRIFSLYIFDSFFENWNVLSQFSGIVCYHRLFSVFISGLRVILSLNHLRNGYRLHKLNI